MALTRAVKTKPACKPAPLVLVGLVLKNDLTVIPAELALDFISFGAQLELEPVHVYSTQGCLY